jgi:hypothetical protein
MNSFYRRETNDFVVIDRILKWILRIERRSNHYSKIDDRFGREGDFWEDVAQLTLC